MYEKNLTLKEKARMMIEDRDVFFYFVEHERGLKNSFVFFFVSLTFIVASLTFYSVIIKAVNDMPIIDAKMLYILVSSAISITLLSLPVSALVYFITVLLRGKGTFFQTVRVFNYSISPFFVLSMVPFAYPFGAVYSIAIMTHGISKVHKISRFKALVATLFPLVAMIVTVSLLPIQIII